MNIIFFGSFQHYSAVILDSLINYQRGLITVSGVVTTPPMPVGRKQIITKTPVHQLAEKYHVPVYTPITLCDGDSSVDFQRTDLSPASGDGPHEVGASTAKSMSNDVQTLIPKPDFFITAGYGKILPQSWLNYPTQGCLNLHFSLLPSYRGANPAEWAIMCGEPKTGITLINMSDKLDGGDILAQAELPITSDDNRETLYEKLYQLGAEMLPTWLLEWQEFAERSRTPLAGVEHRKITVQKQPKVSPTPYAALLKRDDGFLPWSTITKSLQGQTLQADDFPNKHMLKAIFFSESKVLSAEPDPADAAGSRALQNFDSKKFSLFLSRLPRAFATYPSLWTIVSTTKGDKRMKILSFSPFMVQIEGGQPTVYHQIKNQLK